MTVTHHDVVIVLLIVSAALALVGAVVRTPRIDALRLHIVSGATLFYVVAFLVAVWR